MSSPWNHRVVIASNHNDPAVMNAVAAITVGYDARGGWLGGGNPPNHVLIHDFHSNDDGSVYATAIMNALKTINLFESMTLDGNAFPPTTPPPPPPPPLPPPPPPPSARTVTTDKATYTIGDTLHFTGTGFTPNGNVSKCMTTAPPAGVCAGAVTADAQGNVSGDFGIGANIPVGPQTFWLHDQTANVDADAPQLTLLAQSTTPPPSGGGWVKFHESTNWNWWSTQDFLNTNGAAIIPFYSYPDTFVQQLTKDFGYTLTGTAANGKYDLALDPNSHGGAAGSPFGTAGVTIAADSVLTSDPLGQGLTGFWFYLLSLHETINEWTASVTPGWPWANGSDLWQHGSQFPNFADIVVLKELGLTKASEIQSQRMLSSPSVKVLYDIYTTYGWKPYSGMLKLMQTTKVNLTNYSEPLTTAIIILFMSVATGASLFSQFAAAGITIDTPTISTAQNMFPNLSPPPPTITTPPTSDLIVAGALGLAGAGVAAYLLSRRRRKR